MTKRTLLIIAVLSAGCSNQNKPEAVVPDDEPSGGKVVTTEKDAVTPQKKKPRAIDTIPPRTDLPTYATGDVAIVNGETITGLDYNLAVRSDISTAYMNGRDPNSAETILENLVQYRVLAQAAKGYLPKVSERQLDWQYDMETRWGGWAYSPQPEEKAHELEHGYLKLLEQTKAEYREDVREGLSIRLMHEAEDPIDPKYVQAELASNKSRYYVGFIQFDRIEIPIDKTSGKKGAIKRANTIRQKLANGATLDEIGAEKDVIVHARFYASPASNPHLMELKKNEISEPYEQLGKIMVARVIDSEPSTNTPSEEQIKTLIRWNFYEKRRRQYYKATIKKLLPNAKIERFPDALHTNSSYVMKKF